MLTLQNEYEIPVINERIYSPQAVIMETVINNTGTHSDFRDIGIDGAIIHFRINLKIGI